LREDFVFLFLSWEGLGVTSFVLVFFYYTKYTVNAATKTILINRVGDILFLMLIVLSFGTCSKFYRSLLVIGVFTFFFRISKSALFPFWA
jgi:NADH:ubiquinone oxidoreductase subunit 5 (subunit L)/multisubunit Na+/H+ antiporter MnhA subunit